MQIQFKLAAFGAALLLAANACVTVSCGKDENEQPKQRVVAKLKTVYVKLSLLEKKFVNL